MIDVIKNELDYLDISINDTQSVCLRIGKRFNLTTADILIGDKPIVVSHELKYLGICIVAAESCTVDNLTCTFHYYLFCLNLLIKIARRNLEPPIVVHSFIRRLAI